MIIICSKDPNIIALARNPRSGSNAWGALSVIPTTSNQAQATKDLEQFIHTLGQHQALCLSAHANNEEIGGSGENNDLWGWTHQNVAAILKQAAPHGYAGPILIHACCTSVANFSANLAVSLHGIGALPGVWIYGYNRAVGGNESYPTPAQLHTNVSLQGTQVH